MKRPTTRRALTAAVIAALMITAAACGDDTSSNATASTTKPADAAGHNDADAAFVQGMIPHHSQAVEMADLAITSGDSANVNTLAEEIKAAQSPEIEQMRGWLEDWDVAEETSGMDGHGNGGGGIGMMTDDQMSQMSGAAGADLDRMFLEMMIVHHQGAIGMAQTQLQDGQNADAKEMAQNIITSQRTEIDQMQTMLGEDR